MRLGKLNNDQLNDLVLNKFPHTRKEVICAPQAGVDCTAVELSGDIAVLSTDPITSAGRNIGYLTVHVSCNDAAAAGAEPVGLLVTILAPPHATEAEIALIADELSAAAQRVNVDIIGGHTEVTNAVTRFVTCATVLARGEKGRLVTPGGMREGDYIVMTKHAGLEGASIIAADFADKLHMLTRDELSAAVGFMNDISVVKEGLFAAKHGASAMHDATEGGVLGALWELSEASSCGILIDPDAVLVHDITRKICDSFSLDPLRLLSSGCMLIACIDGEAMVKGLKKEGIDAAIIGRATHAGRLLKDGTEIMMPEADEVYKLF